MQMVSGYCFHWNYWFCYRHHHQKVAKCSSYETPPMLGLAGKRVFASLYFWNGNILRGVITVVTEFGYYWTAASGDFKSPSRLFLGGVGGMLCGTRILVLQPGIEPVSPAVEAWSLNHWTTMEALKPFQFLVRFLWPTKWEAGHLVLFWGGLPIDEEMAHSSLSRSTCWSQTSLLSWVRRLSIQEELVKCLQLMKMRTWRNTPFNCFSYIFSTVFYQVMTKTDRLKEH